MADVAEDAQLPVGHDYLKADGAATTASKPYQAFLRFLSAICPNIPQVTYGIVIIAIATLPHDILSLEGPTTSMELLYGHFWLPSETHLLSVQALPRQDSGYMMFLKALIDCTVLLINKALRIELNPDESSRSNDLHNQEEKVQAANPTVDWLLKEQFGQRVWAEGVLVSRNRLRGGPPDYVAADLVGHAFKRLSSLSDEHRRMFVTAMRETTMRAGFPSEPGGASLLDRAIPSLRRFGIELGLDPTQRIICDGIKDVVGEIAAKCVEQIRAMLDARVVTGSEPVGEVANYLLALAEALNYSGVRLSHGTVEVCLSSHEWSKLMTCRR